MRYILVALLALTPQERATLNTPVTLGTVTDYQVTEISLSRPKTIGTIGGDWTLVITYYDNKDKGYIDSHQGVFNATTNPNGADVLIKALNKANLTVQSLNCRALNHLISENKIPGSVVDCTAE